MTSCRKIVTSLSFFGFLANLEQSGGQIRDTKSAKVTFQLIVTFCFRKTKNRTIKSITQLSHYGTFLDKKRSFLQKSAGISKIKRA